MAEPAHPVNSGEEATNAPPATDIGLDAASQFRILSQRIEDLAREIGRIQVPAKPKWPELVQLPMIMVALLVAIYTAFGLSNRIDDLVKAQTATETRLAVQITATETRINGRVDRLDDRIARIGDRAATLEGARSPAR